MIYLDNAATTPLTPSVIDAMTEIMVNDLVTHQVFMGLDVTLTSVCVLTARPLPQL